MTNYNRSVGYILSAVFLCWEYQRLGHDFAQFTFIVISFWIKLAFIILEVGLTIGMYI